MKATFVATTLAALIFACPDFRSLGQTPPPNPVLFI